MKDEPAEHNKHFGIRFASRKTKKKKQLPENYDTCRRLYCAFRLFVLVPIFLIDSIGFGMSITSSYAILVFIFVLIWL